jgi:hypothetical protein
MARKRGHKKLTVKGAHLGMKHEKHRGRKRGGKRHGKKY